MIDFTEDKWMYVRASCIENARQFIGVPDEWVVELDHTRKDGQKVYRIKTEGLRAFLEARLNKAIDEVRK